MKNKEQLSQIAAALSLNFFPCRPLKSAVLILAAPQINSTIVSGKAIKISEHCAVTVAQCTFSGRTLDLCRPGRITGSTYELHALRNLRTSGVPSSDKHVTMSDDELLLPGWTS